MFLSSIIQNAYISAAFSNISMYIPKRYGESKVDNCPFCGQRAIAVSTQGIPVCLKHKGALLGEMKCACGDYLDLLKGKFGPFFNCMKCGNINLKKALELNPIKQGEKSDSAEYKVQEKSKYLKEKSSDKSSVRKFSEDDEESKESRREIFIRSDDPDYF